jgi:hypothetical protein
MTMEESLRRHGLVPSDESLPVIRYLLAHEVELERSGGHREEDLALLCCVQLFGRGALDDALRIWNAKTASMDLGCSIDVQLLCGAGLTATKHFLATHREAAAADALRYLEECEAAGNFRDFSPENHLEYYRRYFDVGAD